MRLSEVDLLKPQADQMQEKSRVEGDGTIVISRRRGAFFSNWFRRTTTTRVVLVGGRKRVPFLTLYQVQLIKKTSVAICVCIIH